MSDSRSSLMEYDPNGGFQSTVFPSLNPSRREDVALLEQWMLAMMDQITAALPKHLRSEPNKVHSKPHLVLLLDFCDSHQAVAIMVQMVNASQLTSSSNQSVKGWGVLLAAEPSARRAVTVRQAQQEAESAPSMQACAWPPYSRPA